MRYVVYLDMDGVLANFSDGAGLPRGSLTCNPPAMFRPNFFANLAPMEGAKEAVAELMSIPSLDLYIASKHSISNIASASEKLGWIKKHFPILLDKVFLTCDKTHLNGQYLIDDNKEDWKNFPGELLWFDERDSIKSWKNIVTYLKEQVKEELL